MNISQYTPIKSGGTIIIPKVSILTIKITLEDPVEIYLNTDALHVMREDTLPEIVLEIRVALIIRRTTKEDIMLTLQRMMNLPKRESNKKMKILQVMKSIVDGPNWHNSQLRDNPIQKLSKLLSIVRYLSLTGLRPRCLP